MLTLLVFILTIIFLLIEYILWKIVFELLEKGEYKKAIKIYKFYPFKTEKDLFNIGFCFPKTKNTKKLWNNTTKP